MKPSKRVKYLRGPVVVVVVGLEWGGLCFVFVKK